MFDVEKLNGLKAEDVISINVGDLAELIAYTNIKQPKKLKRKTTISISKV
jgi:hypothetical protein